MRPALRELWDAYRAAERGQPRPRVIALLRGALEGVETREDRDQLARLALRQWAVAGRRGDVALREPLMREVIRPYLSDHVDDPMTIKMAVRLGEYDLLDRLRRTIGRPGTGWQAP